VSFALFATLVVLAVVVMVVLLYLLVRSWLWGRGGLPGCL